MRPICLPGLILFVFAWHVYPFPNNSVPVTGKEREGTTRVHLFLCHLVVWDRFNEIQLRRVAHKVSLFSFTPKLLSVLFLPIPCGLFDVTPEELSKGSLSDLSEPVEVN